MPGRLTIDDFLAAGICARGVRTAFKDRGLDFRKFLAEGATIEEALAFTPDEFVERAIAKARERDE